MASEPTIAQNAELALAEELLAGIGALRRGLRRSAGAEWFFGPLTGAQAELLRLVRRQPGISVTAAASELRLAANTVSTLVRQLSKAQLLRRDVDPTDRRVARLHLTEEAEARLSRSRDGRVHVVAAALQAMPAKQRRVLVNAVPALAELTLRLDGAGGSLEEEAGDD
ncbi:MarR family winged helix-turn-helix transcriptional regulator [Actinopolymorpha alba]|uniref:MarR family winged helix-turn-helix transcriptional regulator n=1 Tax=Actinopolymorpha alba TaxID=533267 RepID=UPI00036B293B|nr:MarR family transcriptional regulator [Actinopolymorpha alba]